MEAVGRLDVADNAVYEDMKRELKNACTQFVTDEFLSAPDGRFEFLKAIIGRGTSVAATADNGIFIFKGGNVLRLVERELASALPGHAGELIEQAYGDYFARSDADFSIYLPTDEHRYRTLYKAYAMQVDLRDTAFMRDPAKYFGFERLSDEIKQAKLEALREQLTACKCFSDPANKLFYGCTVVGVGCRGVHVGVEPPGYGASDQLILRSVVDGLTYVFSDRKEHDIYVSMNSALRFKRQGSDDTIEFHLARSKLNVVVMLMDSRGNVTRHNIGGELIDVSIPFDTDEVFGADGSIVSYTEKMQRKTISFNSYSIATLAADVYNILFIDAPFPWADSKYQKRIRRLSLLTFAIDLKGTTYDEESLYGVIDEYEMAREAVELGAIPNGDLALTAVAKSCMELASLGGVPGFSIDSMEELRGIMCTQLTTAINVTSMLLPGRKVVSDGQLEHGEFDRVL